jgi:hypothetical protein
MVAAGRRLARLTALLAVPALCLALAPSALAGEPTGAFSVFKECPRNSKEVAENEISCLYSVTEGGKVTIGSTEVPITNHIILQGGIFTSNETEAQRFSAALNGETLNKAPQKVPGGLLDFVKCNEIEEPIEQLACEFAFESGASAVYATTELAKAASAIGINTNNLINSEGVALSLPVKIKLENTFLGGECYIGSEKHPVTLNLTTGTTSPPSPNKPISGEIGDLIFHEEGGGHKLEEITGNKLVDNAFSAPEVAGCGGILFSWLLDPIIDLKLGLPSAAGKNTAIQDNLIKKATAAAVISSE